MKNRIINKENHWEYWSLELKEELKTGLFNKVVGEKLVFENEKIKVWTIHLKPGKRLPFHCHNKKYFWTALSEGKARSYFNNGSVVESEYRIGDTKYYTDLDEDHFFIHDLTNIGNTILIFSTVEFK